MAFEDQLEPDWVYELPFYLVATIAYGVLFTLNPIMRWGGRERAPESAVPIEFVARLPAPSPNLALAPGGDGRAERPPQKGPGEYRPEKVKAGAVDAPVKPAPKPKPAAAKTKPKAAARVRPALDAKAVVAASILRRQRLEALKAAEIERTRVARQKAAAAAEAQARRDAREKAAAQARAEAARVERERQAAVERARRERLAAARAAKAAKRAELSQELATMADPDEALAQEAEASPPPGGRARAKGVTVGGKGGAALAGARKAGAAAALADAAESADPGDAAGAGGADLLDARAKGGGTGPDGSGVSYSLEGPVGNRRILKRTVPTSPDWVGTRGLDLTVTVRFQVLSDGTVKPGAVIRKTSGFPEIDQRALAALRQWRFEPVPAASAEVWGRVTFHFTS